MEKTLKRVRVNHSSIYEEIKPNRKPRQDKLYYRRMAIQVYCNCYRKFYMKEPLNKFMLMQIENAKGSKNARYADAFDSAVKFLLDLRDEHAAWNDMRQLLNDYFTCVLNYYKQYRRRPTLFQLRDGATNTNEFIGFSDHEEYNNGGYWFSKDNITKGQQAAKVHNGYDDPFMDKGLLLSGLKPIYRKDRKLSESGNIIQKGENGLEEIILDDHGKIIQIISLES